jgi:predicted RNA binding protein YcfA (HicA-like mRNA interferase family)
MGRLAGFSYHEISRKLRRLGFGFYRECPGSHELWIHADGRRVMVVRHTKEIPESTLRAILRIGSIDVGEFLSA